MVVWPSTIITEYVKLMHTFGLLQRGAVVITRIWLKVLLESSITRVVPCIRWGQELLISLCIGRMPHIDPNNKKYNASSSPNSALRGSIYQRLGRCRWPVIAPTWMHVCIGTYQLRRVDAWWRQRIVPPARPPARHPQLNIQPSSSICQLLRPRTFWVFQRLLSVGMCQCAAS